MNLEGEITLTRTLLNHEIWQTGEPHDRRSAFVHLLLVANNRPGLPMLRGRVREMRVGQVGHSIAGLAEQWSWSQGKVRRFLEWLAERGTIEFKTETGGEVFIRFTNYDLWNHGRRGGGEVTERQQGGGGEVTETEGEREGERERENPPALRAPEVPSAEEILKVVEKFGWTLDNAEDWRLQKMNDQKYGFHRMLNWQADVLLYARRLDGPPPRRLIGSGGEKNGAKKTGGVSASVEAIRLQQELADIRGEMESVYNTEGASSVAYRRLQREAVDIERQLAGLRGEGQ